MTKNSFLANIYKYKLYFLIYLTILIISSFIISYSQIQDKKFNTSFNFTLVFNEDEFQEYMVSSISKSSDTISKYEEIKYKLTNNNEVKKKYFQDLDIFFENDVHDYIDKNFKDIDYSDMNFSYTNTKKEKYFVNVSTESEEIYNSKNIVIEFFTLLFKQKLKETYINQHNKVIKFLDNEININYKKQNIDDNLFENILLPRYDKLNHAIELINTNKLYSEIADDGNQEELTILSNDSINVDNVVIDRLANINIIDLVKIGKKELLLETNFLSNIIQKYYSDKDNAIKEIKNFYGINQKIKYQIQTMLNLKQDQILLLENIKNEDFDKIFTKLNFSLENNLRANPVSLFNFIKNFIYIFVFGLITVVLINYFILELRSIRNS